MDTTSIKNVKSVFMGTLGAVSKNQSLSGSESFAKVFDQTQGAKGGSGSSQEFEVSNSNKADNVKDYNKLTNHGKTDQLKEKMEQLEKISEEDRMQAAVEEAGAMMVEKAAETLEVSVEEVESVMEALGLTAVDLLNCENLTKIVLALNPQMDALSLMTDETFFTDLKSLMNTANELMLQLQKEFQLTEEGLNQYLESLPELLGNDLTAEELVDPGMVSQEVEEAADSNAKDTFLLFKDNTETAAVDNSLEASAALKTEEAGQGRESTRGDENSAAGKESFSQTIMRQLTEAVEKADAAQSVYSASGEDIINQITDYIKLHVKPQTTELELQLHPASLGNVKVQIASTEGVLTATFTTQNEAVKAALEAQLIQLKENFEQQGLKVESVEVNVAAHGFERSLDQQSDQNRQYEENNKRSGRRIRLSGIDGLEGLMEEELPEEDQVVVDMMLRNGNTVDYTV